MRRVRLNDIAGRRTREMKKFDVIRNVTDEQKFSELIFELITFHDSPDDFAKFLSEDFIGDGPQEEKL